jgi:hypothetical protein
MSWSPQSSDEKASALDDEEYDPPEDGISDIWLCHWRYTPFEGLGLGARALCLMYC